MIWSGNLKMALSSIRRAKWRSLLTMLGIIIGTASVVTTVSLGEGVKQQVAGQINELGNDLITIVPGQPITRDKKGNLTGINILSALGTSTLTEKDYQSIAPLPNITSAVPLSLISGTIQGENTTFNGGLIVATTDALPSTINQKIEYGDFFTASEINKNFAVIGKRIAEEIFGEPNPVAKSFKVHGTEFVVRGVYEEFRNSPLNIGLDYNSAVFIPYETAKQVVGGAPLQLSRIQARTNDQKKLDETVAKIHTTLLANHDGQEDFTVLKQSDSLAITNSFLNVITAFIAGVAAVSLIVGGIGIMNIMLVSVSERTREIGIRKAVGATNRQILNQFMTEAVVLSLSGGIIGVLLSLLGNLLMRIFTNSLKPVVTIEVILVAASASIVVGIIFGITPALKAARKHPIEALRHE